MTTVSEPTKERDTAKPGEEKIAAAQEGAAADVSATEDAYLPRNPATRVSPRGPMAKFLVVDSLVLVTAIALAFVSVFSFRVPPDGATWWTHTFRPANVAIYLYAALPIIALQLFLNFACGLYDFVNNRTKLDIAYYSFVAIGIGTVIEVFILLYIDKYQLLGKELEISRAVIVASSVYLYFGAILWRFAYLERRRRWAYDSTRLLIIGAGEIGQVALREIQRYSRLGHEVIGMIDDDVSEDEAPVKVLGRLQDLRSIVEKHAIDEIIVAAEMSHRSKLLDILYVCEQTDVRIRVLPDLYDSLIGKVQIQQVGGVPLIEVRNGEVPNYIAMRKRAFDYVFSAFFLILFVLTFPFIAIAIKLQDGGPVFYRQERVGRNRKRFLIFKYRTMVVGAEKMTGPVLSTDHDDRVTRVGRFLRRFYIDEWPQLLNVLRGDMSLVGPRPERPMFVETFMQQDPSYRLRLTVRPGITGLAQIHGYYGTSVPNKLRYDIAYINARSTLLDLKILMLTFMVAVSGKRI